MDTYNSHAKFGCQTQARQKINKITYRKSQQTPSLTLILNFFGTLTEHWNFKYIGNRIKKLKYLNKGSTHTNAKFNAIPSGIFYRLVNLTSRTKKNAQMKIDERYQGHAKGLIKGQAGSKSISNYE